MIGPHMSSTLNNNPYDHLFPQTLADFEEEYSIRAMEGNFDTVDVRFRIYDAHGLWQWH